MAALVGLALLVLGVLIGARTPKGQQLVAAASYYSETVEPESTSLDTPAELVAYLRKHPDRYALAAWELGEEDGGVFHDPDSAWPLASTVKLEVLAAVAEALDHDGWDAGELVDPAEVERFYLAGTDGNAHSSAVADLKARDAGRTLDDQLFAMLRFSDNAATDFVMHRLGRARLDDAGVHPLTGQFAAARAHDDGGVDDAAWRWLEILATDGGAVRASLRDEGLLLSVAEQEAMTRNFDNRGAARAYARRLEQLFADERPAIVFARRHLTWPMAFEPNRRDFELLATKGGSLPGTLTSVYFAKTKRGHQRVLALFFHDLPFATWVGMSQSFVQQKLERATLLDDDGLERLRKQIQE